MPLLNPDTDKWLLTNELRPISKAQPTPNAFDDATEYRVEMQPIRHTFHPKLPDIPVWSYSKDSLGLIVEAQSGAPTRVMWFNNLSGASLQALLDLGDRQGMEEDHMMTTPHDVVHLHGSRVPWTSDGFPEHVYHPREAHSFFYPNVQPATALWFHDHAMDVTRLNVYAGLYGMYLLRGPEESALLPSGDLEIPLILQDKTFSDDGAKLRYEQQVAFTDRNSATGKRTLDATPEFIGDFPVVNGQIWPVSLLRPRVYRLRFLNGANARFFNLSWKQDGSSATVPMWVIGSDGGFLPAPVKVSHLLIAPGERADVLLDLRHCKGTQLILSNDAPCPYSGDPADSHFNKGDHSYSALDPTDPSAELLKIIVDGEHDSTDKRFDPNSITLPARVDPLVVKPPAQAIPARGEFPALEAAIEAVPIDVMEADLTANGVNFKLRRFKLEEYRLEMDTFPGIRVPSVQVNGQSWRTAPALKTSANALEVWEFVNVTPDTHPMHLHLVQFQIMSRTWIQVAPDPSRVSPELPEPQKATGYLPDDLPATVLEDYEKGWKDTVRCNPQQSTRILVRFDGFTGDYVYHCHILEHEDMGMMYRLTVEP